MKPAAWRTAARSPGFARSPKPISATAGHPALVGREGDAILDSFVFAGRRDVIDGVWRAGRKLVSNGRHHRRDEIAARYRQALEKVLA
jgi:formimidoylglutamate deiminase